MSEQELNQIFGTLDSLIPLHEGISPCIQYIGEMVVYNFRVVYKIYKLKYAAMSSIYIYLKYLYRFMFMEQDFTLELVGIC